jgi:hypothetical protein
MSSCEWVLLSAGSTKANIPAWAKFSGVWRPSINPCESTVQAWMGGAALGASNNFRMPWRGLRGPDRS